MPPIADDRPTREMRKTELQSLLRNPNAVDLEVEVEIAGPAGSSDGIPAAVTDNPPAPSPRAALAPALPRPRIVMRALTSRYPIAPGGQPIALRIAAFAAALSLAWLVAML